MTVDVTITRDSSGMMRYAFETPDRGLVRCIHITRVPEPWRFTVHRQLEAMKRQGYKLEVRSVLLGATQEPADFMTMPGSTKQVRMMRGPMRAVGQRFIYKGRELVGEIIKPSKSTWQLQWLGHEPEIFNSYDECHEHAMKGQPWQPAKSTKQTATS